MTLANGAIVSGRYEIIEKIGVGGMATVYRAEDIKLDRSVTLKVLKEEYTEDADFKERFKTEAKAAAKLSHPNIVNVYDVGEDDGIYYIVMEYIHGDSLKQIITSSAPFDTATTLSIAGQIASALKHAHKNGVVHRDIKPHNILVSVDGTIKVTDFGIARAAAVSTATTTSTALGSVYYLSPEQARGGYVDFKSDIYSLGVTMYEMATGKVPYDGDTSVAIALQHINKDLPDIRQYNPQASDILQKIILKATRKKKDDRYGSVALMLEDLKTALSELARPQSKRDDKANNGLKAEGAAAGIHKSPEAGAVPQRVSKDIKEEIPARQALRQEAEDIHNIDEERPVRKARSDNEVPDLGSLDDEIKMEIGPKPKTYELPERSVGFDMYNKKLKISKEDDNFESTVYHGGQKPSKPRQNGAGTPKKKSPAKQPKKKKKPGDVDKDPDYRKKERQITIAAVVTAGIIIAIITFFGVRMITGGGGNKNNVSVNSMPNIVGMTLEEAQEETKNLEITIKAENEEYSSLYDEGVIMEQAISVGTSVSKGDVINVTVSKGNLAFAMPSVVFDAEADAINKIRNLGGSTPEVEYVFDDVVPVGVVVEQTPEAQTQIDSSTSILLKVSKGAETPMVTVPNFLGMKLGDAQTLLLERGLSLGDVRENNDADGEKDKILSQSLTSGSEVERDTKIDFVVVGSKIEEAPEVPDEPEVPVEPSTPEPDPEPPAASSGTAPVSVPVPTVYDDENNISVKVLEITNGSSVEVKYSETKSLSDFPYTFNLSGSGTVELQLYVDNVYQWSQTVTYN